MSLTPSLLSSGYTARMADGRRVGLLQQRLRDGSSGKKAALEALEARASHQEAAKAGAFVREAAALSGMSRSAVDRLAKTLLNQEQGVVQ